HGAGHRTFAVTPGNLLHHHAMRGTLDPPRGVAIPGRDAPQRHKLPAPFRQTVIARSRSLAQRAAPAHTAMRRDPDLNEVRLPSVAMHPYLFVHETRKTLYSIQNGFNRNFRFSSQQPTLYAPLGTPAHKYFLWPSPGLGTESRLCECEPPTAGRGLPIWFCQTPLPSLLVWIDFPAPTASAIPPEATAQRSAGAYCQTTVS